MATSAKDRKRKVRYGDQQVTRSAGGETHQVAGNGRPSLTTQQGVVVSDDQNTLRAGERGPGLLGGLPLPGEDLPLRPRADPRAGRARPRLRAHGYFENYAPLTDLTRADIFSEAGLRTPAFVRFSTVAGSKGSADLARDVRGFAVKFYTREGNWDLVGNNIPVFFIQDAIKFPDLIHAAKPEPDRGFPQAQTAHDNFWDFASLMPESTHMLMWIMSDRAIPRSFRFMEGFGVHTFRLVNAAGRSTYVKFHWKPKQGLQSVVWNEAVKINGADPGLPPARPVGRDQQRRLPRVGAGPAAVRRRVRRPVRVRRPRPHQAHPRGGGAGPPGRAAGPRPRGRQLLRRDRAGRLLHPEHRARHRLHQRPAAAGPQLLLPRHPAQAARRPQLHPAPGQRAEVPVRALPAGRPHGHEQPGHAGPTTSRTRGPAPRAARARTRRPATAAIPAEEARGRSGGCARRASPTTTARPASSTSARPPSSSRHIADAFTFELSKCERRGDPAPHGGRPPQRRRGARRGGGRGPGTARAARRDRAGPPSRAATSRRPPR